MTNSKLLTLGAFGLVCLTIVVFAPDVRLGAKPSTVSSFDTLKTLQETYKAQKGDYLQIIDGEVPPTISGTTKTLLWVDIDPSISITPYVTPDGSKGYQLIEKTSTQVRSENVGSTREAWRTYIEDISVSTSTTGLNAYTDFFSFAYPLAEAITTNTHSASTTRASSQYFSITDGLQTGLDGGASMTFCTWFRLATYNSAGDNHTLAGKGSATGGTRQFRWSVRGSAGSTVWVFQASSLGSSFDGDTTVTDTIVLSPMTWYHACVVFDGANTDTLYYRNGAQISTTQNNTISSIFNSTRPFSIGAENVGVTPAEFLNGQVDDFRVWTRVLSATEIADQYNSPCDDTKIGANNSAQWLFDNDALDVTANNNDLTAANGATYTTASAYSCSAASAPPDWTDQGDTYYYP